MKTVTTPIRGVRKRTTEKLTRKHLKPGAVPCVWPGADHLTKSVIPRPTSFASSESRQENVERLHEEAERERIARDTFGSLEELISKEHQIEIPDGVYKVVDLQFVIFFKLCPDSEVPRMKYSVKIQKDLSVLAHFEDLRITNADMRIEVTNRCTTLNAIFSFLESSPSKSISDEEMIDDTLKILKSPRFQTNKKVEFIIEQSILLLKKPNARRSSSSMLASLLSPTLRGRFTTDKFCNRCR